VDAVVVQVHTHDSDTYYTIHLACTGQERQTERSRLRREGERFAMCTSSEAAGGRKAHGHTPADGSQPLEKPSAGCNPTNAGEGHDASTPGGNPMPRGEASEDGEERVMKVRQALDEETRPE